MDGPAPRGSGHHIHHIGQKVMDDLGGDFNGEYSVMIAPEGEEVRTFTGLRSYSGEMPVFNYVGIYILKEKNDSVMYIDRLELTNDGDIWGGV
ncbi:hypothetical protein Back11_34940 [Paenibacillus baekrokdamisoli]|uniref:Uncharacterized protein n=1 Tax=Paenibacillus baekrokdamisoli TaxID=1712516 RepID=A0A3G9JGN2_9BACL|nr:hypothetical protein [Paenibacillus baekrokdamisoli]MBB3070912.1 hypothetical protein [Paenibacillus baekrokdamisoli]BBH22149.1 hypothetical protein Back11_34940 [Paenibacillus baekrokdamisoli]